MKIVDENKCFGGRLLVVEHDSAALSCGMTFSVFLPPQADGGDCPALFFLSGLTCTHENFTTKAGAYKRAAELGMIVVAPDTSPRGDDVPDDADSYDFGKGAGFYINATQQPWAQHYRMEAYIAEALYDLVMDAFPISKIGISGHSMGGAWGVDALHEIPRAFCQLLGVFADCCADASAVGGEGVFALFGR